VFRGAIGSVYSQEESDISTISDGLRATTRQLTTASSLFSDEGRAIDAGFLEDLKQLRDLLASIKVSILFCDSYLANDLKLDRSLEPS
jgi:hypothetical protein